MKILVIGGSYFFGRWFVQFAYKNHEVTVLNRGNIPVQLDNVKCITADRHDFDTISQYKEDKYDCIVDFCAYQQGDIEGICKVFGHSQMKYIFISTVDVYAKQKGAVLDENSPFTDENLPGEIGAYIGGKVKLEKELKRLSWEMGFKAVSVRPAIIYGPANYAPREKVFFDYIRQLNQVILPEDASGFFQFIYVGDAARGLLEICQQDISNTEDAYNFANADKDTYQSFAASLREAISDDYQEVYLPVSQILERNIPLPFPLTEEESQLYTTGRFDQLIKDKTILAQGLKKELAVM